MTRQTSLDTTDANALLRLWRSVFPVPLRPRTEKDRKRFLRSNLILHFRPPAVKEKTLTFTLSWGLGGMAATLVLLQMATGILLKFIYVPTPVDAYASVQTIITQVPFGRLVRNLHHWCANLLVVILMLHMLRVFFTGAFHSPRQFNWIIGLVLFTMVLAANLSGYLLPYDQLAYWAVTVITAMLGYIPGIGGWLHRALGNGAELGPQTLPFFYSMHTAVIPVLLVGLMGFHFWRIRKAGGLVVPRKSSEPMDEMPTRIPVVPHLLVREVSTALVLTATVVVLSIFLDAPLSTPANPGLSPNPVRAPWYFAGLQELLLHVHPAVAVSVIPLLYGDGHHPCPDRG
ncbi:MAG: cytochrome b N-terminal domain-containing protein [Desulfosarcina sp.]|nr:cytochrome b N-terminal domain-containing protein [Desulfosarcina sp.]